MGSRFLSAAGAWRGTEPVGRYMADNVQNGVRAIPKPFQRQRTFLDPHKMAETNPRATADVIVVVAVPVRVAVVQGGDGQAGIAVVAVELVGKKQNSIQG